MKKYFVLFLFVFMCFASCENNGNVKSESIGVTNESKETNQESETEADRLSEAELLQAMEIENQSENPVTDTDPENIRFQNANKLMQSDCMETTFFSMRVDKIAVTDTVAEYTAHDGMNFLVLDVHLENVTDHNDRLASGNVPMYATDFCLYWDEAMENGTYPASTGILEELPTEYELEDCKDGKLIYLIPENAEMVYLVYEEYYTYGELSESKLMDTWVMKMLPVDWEREKKK